jgi:hypothetical protein
MNLHYEKGQNNKKISQVKVRIIKGENFENEENQRKKNPSKGEKAKREG